MHSGVMDLPASETDSGINIILHILWTRELSALITGDHDL